MFCLFAAVLISGTLLFIILETVLLICLGIPVCLALLPRQEVRRLCAAGRRMAVVFSDLFQNSETTQA